MTAVNAFYRSISGAALLLFLLPLAIAAQEPTSTPQNELNRLIKKLRDSKSSIECAHIGYAGMDSEVFFAADSLNKICTNEDRGKLFADSNYLLKFYAFHGILRENDSVAFHLLSLSIQDSTDCFYRCGCQIEMIKFNQLLLLEYFHYIERKYKIGGTVVPGGEYATYVFPEPDLKIWKIKRKELRGLVSRSGSDHLLEALNYWDR